MNLRATMFRSRRWRAEQPYKELAPLSAGIPDWMSAPKARGCGAHAELHHLRAIDCATKTQRDPDAHLELARAPFNAQDRRSLFAGKADISQRSPDDRDL
jgi:hypothetical protein